MIITKREMLDVEGVVLILFRCKGIINHFVLLAMKNLVRIDFNHLKKSIDQEYTEL
jgi:hypothetical protein